MLSVAAPRVCLARRYKRSVLERAFALADSTNAGALTIGDFMRYIGQGGVLHVNPVALKMTAGLADRDQSGSLLPGMGSDDDGSDVPWGEMLGGGMGDPDPPPPAQPPRAPAAPPRAPVAPPFSGSQMDETVDDMYASNLRRELEDSSVLPQMPHITKLHVESCIEFYRAFDADRDGHLTPREFVTALKAYGRATGNPDAYQRRHLLDAFDAADVSADAQLEISEFVKFIGKNGKVNMEVRAMRRAAADWMELKGFEATHGGMSGGVLHGQGQNGQQQQQQQQMSVHEFQRQQALAAQQIAQRQQLQREQEAKARKGGLMSKIGGGAPPPTAKRGGQRAAGVAGAAGAAVSTGEMDDAIYNGVQQARGTAGAALGNAADSSTRLAAAARERMGETKDVSKALAGKMGGLAGGAFEYMRNCTGAAMDAPAAQRAMGGRPAGQRVMHGDGGRKGAGAVAPPKPKFDATRFIRDDAINPAKLAAQSASAQKATGKGTKVAYGALNMMSNYLQ